jgi:hypothetical protein
LGKKLGQRLVFLELDYFKAFKFFFLVSFFNEPTEVGIP